MVEYNIILYSKHTDDIFDSAAIIYKTTLYIYYIH